MLRPCRTAVGNVVPLIRLSVCSVGQWARCDVCLRFVLPHDDHSTQQCLGLGSLFGVPSFLLLLVRHSIFFISKSVIFYLFYLGTCFPSSLLMA